MSELIRCDFCKREDRDPTDRWLKVGRYPGISMRGLEDEMGPWHFCSALCTLSYYQHSVVRADVKLMGIIVEILGGGRVEIRDDWLRVYDGKLPLPWKSLVWEREPVEMPVSAYQTRFKPGPVVVVRTEK